MRCCSSTFYAAHNLWGDLSWVKWIFPQVSGPKEQPLCAAEPRQFKKCDVVSVLILWRQQKRKGIHFPKQGYIYICATTPRLLPRRCCKHIVLLILYEKACIMWTLAGWLFKWCVYKKRRQFFFATHAKEEEHFVQHSRISIYFYLIIIPSLWNCALVLSGLNLSQPHMRVFGDAKCASYNWKLFLEKVQIFFP